MKLSPVNVGRRDYDSRPVMITDPCYDSSVVGCFMKGVQVKPGNYRCVAWKGRLSYTDGLGKRHRYSRVFVTGVYLDGFVPDMNDGIEFGNIAVDAGLAGFFQDKPDYTDAEWDEFCDKVNNKNAVILPEGFCTETGYGDGWYPVYKYVNLDGEIVGLEIRY